MVMNCIATGIPCVILRMDIPLGCEPPRVGNAKINGFNLRMQPEYSRLTHTPRPEICILF